MSEEEVKQFAIEYEALCRKHKMFHDSCGCCWGVYLSPLKDDAKFESGYSAFTEKYCAGF